MVDGLWSAGYLLGQGGFHEGVMGLGWDLQKEEIFETYPLDYHVGALEREE